METKIKNLLARLAFFAEDGMAEPSIVAIAKDADALLKEMYRTQAQQAAIKDSLTADRQAEPVAWMYTRTFNGETFLAKQCEDWPHHTRQPLYAAQPPAVAVPDAKQNIGTLPVKDRYFLCRCEKCGWLGSSEECRESINHMYGDGDYYCPVCGANGPDEMYSAEETFNAMLAAAPQATAEDSSAVLQAVAVPKAPTWYKRSEIVKALERMNYHSAIADELADWFLRHMQLAFNRGFYQAHGPAAATQMDELELWHLLERATGELTRRAAPHVWEQIAWTAGAEFIEQRRARLAAALKGGA